MHSGNSQRSGWMWRNVFDMYSPSGARGRLTTLIFHRVRPQPDELFPNEVHADSFRERLEWICAWFNVLRLDDAVSSLASGDIPARALAITFDDGYADNAEVALPILKEFGVPATFFVSTGYLDGGRMWNDCVIEAVRCARKDVIDLTDIGLGVHRIDTAEARRTTIGELLAKLKYLVPSERSERVSAIESKVAGYTQASLMMTSDQVRVLAQNGMGIGAHTVTHPILTRIDARSAAREIADSRDFLSGVLREPVTLFAYPNGKPQHDYASEHVAVVKDLGFRAAMSTAWGSACTRDPLFELPRFTPWGGTRWRWATGLVRNFGRTAERAAA